MCGIGCVEWHGNKLPGRCSIVFHRNWEEKKKKKKNIESEAGWICQII